MEKLKKFTHIDVRTVVEIPSFGEESFHIMKYEESNPSFDDDHIRKFYSIYGKRNKLWEVVADFYDYDCAKLTGRMLANINLATLTEDNLIKLPQEGKGGENAKDSD